VNICTICTPDSPWLDWHLPRWLRHVKQSNPTACLCLFIPCDDARVVNHYVVKSFDKVKLYPGMTKAQIRPWVNEVRMDATEVFGVDEILYIDCDCDIYEDLSGIADVSDKDLMWCRSPVVHPPWMQFCEKLGFGIPDWVANNGLLYLRKSFAKEYKLAKEYCEKFEKPERIAGTFAFNAMLRMQPDISAEVPYEYSTIWWDGLKLRPAKTIQYCSDKGQQKRIMLEEKWRKTWCQE